jgi:hypothetical protein
MAASVAAGPLQDGQQAFEEGHLLNTVSFHLLKN